MRSILLSPGASDLVVILLVCLTILGFVGFGLSLWFLTRVKQEPGQAAGNGLPFLAASSALLSASWEEPPNAIRQIVRLSVPQVADWSAAYLMDDDGAAILVAVSHAEYEDARAAVAFERYLSAVMADPASAQTQFYPRLSEAHMEALATQEETLQLVKALRPRSWIQVPIRTRDRVSGVLVFATARSRRRFGPNDLAIAEDLAGRTSTAIDHAMVYGDAQEAVRQAEQQTVMLSLVSRQLEWVSRQNESILNAAGEGIYGTDRDGRATFVNRAGAKMLGYGEGELIGQEMRRAIHLSQADRTPVAAGDCLVTQTLSDGVEVRSAHCYLWRKDGTSFPAAYVSTPLMEGDELIGSVVVFSDITERRQAEEALKEQERLYRLVTDNSRDVVSLHGRDGLLLYISPSCESVLGYSQEELLGCDPADWIHPEDIRHARAAYSSLRSGTPVSYRIRRKSGEYIWFETVSQPIRDADGRIVQIQASSRDITERKAFEEQLARQAYTDPLTGLSNRVALLDRMTHAITRATRRHEQVAVVFLDLDNFKMVNDSLGHEAGDHLLIFVARRLQGCLRAEDTAARLGGDEFTILLEGVHEVQDVVRVVDRISAALQAPFIVDGHEVFVTFSIGMTLSRSGQQDPRELLREADVAMYYAKHKGKARSAFFDASMNFRLLDRLSLESDLRRAVERGEFRVHYQPMIDLASGSISGVEALVRWEHPERGMIYPDEFIPLAEETGLIVEIGEWVLKEACRQAQGWEAVYQGSAPLTISVNLSAGQLLQPDLSETVARTLAETGMSPTSLQLEITESVLMQDVETAIRVLHELKSLGVQLAIDDFGTGYSALSYFKRFPFDVLKIDRTFVKGLGEDKQDSAIVRTVIMLAKTLNLVVVGEGIETSTQLGQLQVLGCDRGQGYHFARPLPGEEVNELLRSIPGEFSI